MSTQWPKGLIGVRGNDGATTALETESQVDVAGDLSLQKDYKDKAQVFSFQDFITKDDDGSTSNLLDHMNAFKESLESYSSDEDDDDCIESFEQSLLKDLHQRFLPIVEETIEQYGLYSSTLKQYQEQVDNESGKHSNASYSLCRSGLPQVRDAEDQYAGYLHNDMWVVEDDDDDDAPILAMLNVWFVLNEAPPSNSLVFLETSAKDTSQSHMLHGIYQQVHKKKTVVHDENMCWGRFYVFVAGQRKVNDSDRVLLHGAMDLPQKNKLQATRRSVEMRYKVILNK